MLVIEDQRKGIELTPSKLIQIAADAIADLAGTQAMALNSTSKEVSRRPEFIARLENILYVATGIHYTVTIKE